MVFRLNRLVIVALFGSLAFFAIAQRPSPGTSKEAGGTLKIGADEIDIDEADGRLVFQKRNADGLPVGVPWYWPETATSEIRYENPQLVTREGGTWLVFVERSADGSVRSRAISLSEVFVDGFEAGTTAAWSITEPAVNLFIDSPSEDEAVADATPAIVVRFGTPTGIAIAPETLSFTRGGVPLAVDCIATADGAECLPKGPFEDGPVSLEATIADIAGHLSLSVDRHFRIDSVAPSILLDSPAEGFQAAQASVLVSGSASEAATLEVAGTAVPSGRDGSFAVQVPLAEGANVVVVKATDSAGNETAVARNGWCDSTPPLPVSYSLVSTALRGGTVTITGAAGAAELGVKVRWRNQQTGRLVEVPATADGSFSTSIAGAEGDDLMVIAIDAFDRESPPAYFPVDYQVPPDPTPFAPPMDPTVAYDLGDAISFLYQGPNALQKGVAPGAIEERRLAWLRGELIQRGGAPLPGVKISVRDRPELGYTLTRADGVFDLVVNGGGFPISQRTTRCRRRYR